MNTSSKAWAIAEVVLGAATVLTTKWVTGLDWGTWFTIIAGTAVGMLGLAKLTRDERR